MAHLVTLPEIGYSMAEATIIKWNCNEGDKINEGDMLLEIETEKTTSEVVSPASGVILKVLAEEGDVIGSDQVVCIIGQEDENIEGLLKEITGEQNRDNVLKHKEQEEIESQGKVFSTPAARRVAREHGVELSEVKGTGPRGKVTRDDVLQFVQDREEILDEEDLEVVLLSSTRKTIAKRLKTSKKEIPDVTTFIEVNVSDLITVRREASVSFTAIITKAAIEAMKDFPLVNSMIKEDRIYIHKSINIGVAVDTDRGLMVPVIFDAGKKDLYQVSKLIDTLSEKARQGNLDLKDLSGGTFTVTNSGIFGSAFFTPIINYPEVAVLGIGSAQKSAIVEDDKVVVGWKMILCLTYDHRVIDGSYAVKYLASIRSLLENPRSLLRK